MKHLIYFDRIAILFTTLCLGVACFVSTATAVPNHHDPCGMVPPIYTGNGKPISRIGLQQTYVFYKDGVETFVIRPGFTGKVDEFGMLIPFPNPPALRKVPDDVFPHIAAAVDPPEIQVYVGGWGMQNNFANANGVAMPKSQNQQLSIRRSEVRVLKEEAVGMYEVAVLEAGSPEALQRWMDKHGYQYPKGMDKVASEYIEAKWCFVAVKTRVGQKAGVNPKPGQKKLDAKMPSGASFDGHVQGMGFRFRTKELVVPMRLSAFNDGDMRNIVYLLTDEPKKIRSIPEEYVQRQISGKELIKNVTQPLPVRIIGGTAKDMQPYQIKQLPKQRNPDPHNGFAKRLFAADLLAIERDDLSMPHEEYEKELLRIGEHFGLRGQQIDTANAAALKKEADQVVAVGLNKIADMTLTVVDGDFPREVLAKQNLHFAEYKMPVRRNNSKNYDPKLNGPAPKKQGVLKTGHIDWSKYLDSPQRETRHASRNRILGGLAGASSMLLLMGSIFLYFKRRK